MKNGFMLGVAIGAAAAMAYETGSKAKKSLENGKSKVKKKLENILD